MLLVAAVPAPLHAEAPAAWWRFCNEVTKPVQ